MLTKPALVTVIPAVAGRDSVPASHVCATIPPPGLGGGGILPPPPPPPPPGTYVPPDGTPIILEVDNGDGTFTDYTGLAPAPAGFVCRIETRWVTTTGSTEPAAEYQVVCTWTAP